MWHELNGYVTLGMLYFCMALCALMTYVFLRGWYNSLKCARRIEDIPTSRIPSAAQGYVELIGRQYVPPDQTVEAPLTGTPCTWWRYRIQVQKRGLDGKKSLTTLEEGTSSTPILLKNRGGELLVDPDGAEVTPSITHRWRGRLASPPRPMDVRDHVRNGRYLYTEERMRVGEKLYVAGELHTFSGHRQGETFERAVADLLAQWKQDQGRLVERFDTDQDGRIDMAEWEAAREAARTEVAARMRRSEAEPEVDVVRKPENGEPFMLGGGGSQIDMARIYRSKAADALMVSIVFGAMLIYLIHLIP
ncbi:GIDE domain-containing protein [Oleiagrimonas citrea]|uniref:EF-hand domain-containing protein n=1 Tax=Oleiagrimonas citrea TaxID=1665687 RepID=A0A846ZJD3_9GAMM|nr:hypothetical protein [Oleiagrimonas citrea]NKZ38405.1 hypothetical protein [Oleiagrimonas citrea]